MAIFVAFMLLLPWLIGRTLSDVAVTIGIFVLMGLGLNIAIGLAGLLDLGYLTNYAVGAYILAVLTSIGPLGLFKGTFTFWMVIPIGAAGGDVRRVSFSPCPCCACAAIIWRLPRSASAKSSASWRYLRLAQAPDRRRAGRAGDPETISSSAPSSKTRSSSITSCLVASLVTALCFDSLEQFAHRTAVDGDSRRRRCGDRHGH